MMWGGSRLLGPTIASGVILNPQILREYIALADCFILNIFVSLLPESDHVSPAV